MQKKMQFTGITQILLLEAFSDLADGQCLFSKLFFYIVHTNNQSYLSIDVIIRNSTFEFYINGTCSIALDKTIMFRIKNKIIFWHITLLFNKQ